MSKRLMLAKQIAAMAETIEWNRGNTGEYAQGSLSDIKSKIEGCNADIKHLQECIQEKEKRRTTLLKDLQDQRAKIALKEIRLTELIKQLEED